MTPPAGAPILCAAGRRTKPREYAAEPDFNDDATHTTQRFSPVPGGSGDGQALPRSVERIDEARRAAEAQSAVCDAIRAEIMEVFRQLDDEVDFMILFRRYILLEDWPDIAVIVRISRSQMFQRHSAAIKRLDIKSPD